MKNFGNSSHGRSQGAPKIFRAPTYRDNRAHCAVFAIAQISHEVLTDFTYRNLHGFARNAGDSTALVLSCCVTIKASPLTGSDEGVKDTEGKSKAKARDIQHKSSAVIKPVR